MTCIVGLVSKDGVWLGGDGLGSTEHTKCKVAGGKVFRNGEFVMGFCGDFRIGQILRYAFIPPPINGDITRYMCVEFSNALRAAFKDAGYLQTNDGVERGGDFLVGIRGRLFCVESNFQVIETVLPYIAIGSGDSYAMGAMYANRKGKPRDRVMLALKAAAEFCPSVGGPFKVIHA